MGPGSKRKEMKARVSPAKCIIKGHDFELLYTHLNDDPGRPIEGVMLVCRRCGAQRPKWGLLRQGAKLYNDKGHWVATVKKRAVK